MTTTTTKLTRRIITARERERRAWELSCAGYTQAAIAAELGMTSQGVGKVLKRVEQRLRAELHGRIHDERMRQEARLRYLYGEAAEGWRSSKLNRRKQVQRTRTGTDGKPQTEDIVTLEARPEGNPQFLQAALSALADIRKLWGLDAPAKLAVVEHDRPLEHLTDEEINAQLRALYAEAKQLGMTIDVEPIPGTDA